MDEKFQKEAIYIFWNLIPQKYEWADEYYEWTDDSYE